MQTLDRVVFCGEELTFRETGFLKDDFVGDFLPTVFLIVWIIMIGMRLYLRLPKKYSLHFTLFAISGALIIAGAIMIAFFKNGMVTLQWSLVPLIVLLLISAVIFFSFISRANSLRQTAKLRSSIILTLQSKIENLIIFRSSY